MEIGVNVGINDPRLSHQSARSTPHTDKDLNTGIFNTFIFVKELEEDEDETTYFLGSGRWMYKHVYMPTTNLLSCSLDVNLKHNPHPHPAPLLLFFLLLPPSPPLWDDSLILYQPVNNQKLDPTAPTRSQTQTEKVQGCKVESCNSILSLFLIKSVCS